MKGIKIIINIVGFSSFTLFSIAGFMIHPALGLAITGCILFAFLVALVHIKKEMEDQ
jgi:mannose/fructose/N-acetylgalactosamine-specific phosphotransferase system component IIC